MVITYSGENYFKLASGDLTILVDPTNLRSLKGADLVLKTVGGEEKDDEGPLTINSGGEYEIKGIRVFGASAGEENGDEKTIYRLEMDEITFGIIGPLRKEPNPKTLELVEGVDILILPAGGRPFLEAEQAAKIARQVKPAIIIPSFCKDPRPFLKEMGSGKSEAEEKLVLKKKDLKPKAMRVVCLKA